MKRSARLLLIALLSVTAAAAAASLWLMHTPSGARWAWSRAVHALDGLDASSLEGTLRGGLTITGLGYRDEARDVRIARAVIAVNPDLFPTRLVVEELALHGVRVRATGAATPPRDTQLELGVLLQSLQPPVPLLARSVTVEDVEVVAADGTRRARLSSLELSGRLFEALEIHTLQLAAPALQVDVEGGVDLQAPYALAPGTRIAAVIGGERPTRLDAVLSGALGELLLELASDAPAVTLGGTLSLLGSEPTFDLTAASPHFALPAAANDTAVTFGDLRLHVSGQPAAYAVELQTEVETRWSGRMRAAARGQGDLEGVRVEELTLNATDIAAQAGGNVRWAPSFAIEADAVLQRLDPARWLAGWPAEAPLRGRLAGAWNGARIDVAALALQHEASGAQLAGAGVVDVAAGVVDGELHWEALRWPLAAARADVASRSGRLQLSGTPRDWSVAGEIAVSAPELPEGRFRLSGNGDLDRAQFAIAESDVLGGSVTGDLEFTWRGAGAWSAALAADDVRIRPFLPDWPGQVSAQFTAGGQREPFELRADIAALHGQLRGRDVAASGRIALAGDNLRVDALRIASAASRIELDGDFRDEAGLDFVLAIGSLGDLVPGAAGTLAGSGNVAAADGLPRLALELEGSDLRWRDYGADTLTLANRPAAQQPFEVDIAAGDVSIGESALDSVSLELRGSPADHRLALAATLAASRLRLGAEGGIDRLDDLAAARWDGRLTELAVESGERLAMALERPAAVTVSAPATTLNRSCLAATDGSTVCASASRAGSGAYASVVELSGVPLDLVHLFMDSDLAFSQTLSGTVQVARPPGGRLSAGGRISLAPGQIRNTLDERLTLATRAGFAHFALHDGNLLSGELSLPFSDNAELRGEFRVTDVGRGAASPVEGFLRANVNDIGVGASIVPMIDEAGGRLTADVRIEGTLEAPQFSGSASLADGRIVYDPLGIRIDDIQLDGDIRAGNRVELRSTFRAGAGRGEITTSADYLQGRQAGLEVALSGSDLTLIDVPALRVKANADLRLGLHQNDVTINGRIVLPEARLSSVDLKPGTVSESPDVEIVSDAATADAEQQKPASPLDFRGSVDLELGNRVRIDVDLAQARLQGASRFTWSGPAMPTSRGAYDVSGKFQAYGQLLQITEGTIRYPNVPANRPELRIRAEREIFGNSEVRRAGVLVTGTPTRPTLEVYTTPATTEDRALTLLATGSDFDYEQGVGAVDVGTYIAPRLYASYGVGLFDKENVISVRYDLASGFGIKATSGKRADGVDLSYTIEH